MSPQSRKTHSRPILNCITVSASWFYTTFPSDAPSSDFSPSSAASTARHLLSSSAAASSAAFFAYALDSAISKADFLAFLIASPTGKSFEVTSECLVEPYTHRFCWFFPADSSLWVLVPLPCWWDLFQTASMDYSPSHFAFHKQAIIKQQIYDNMISRRSGMDYSP